MAKREGYERFVRGRQRLSVPPPAGDTVALVSDDEPWRRALAASLRDVGFVVLEETASRRAIRFLSPQAARSKTIQPPDGLILDLANGTEGGMALLESVRLRDGGMPIIVIGPRYQAAVYDRLLGLDPSVVFEAPVAVDPVVATALNLMGSAVASVPLAS